jgi:hypothetical protein
MSLASLPHNMKLGEGPYATMRITTTPSAISYKRNMHE